MTEYRIILDNGRNVMSLGDSAAHAIEEARWTFRGHKIVGCYKGVKQYDYDMIKRYDKAAKPMLGWIDHDVPPHEAIPESVIRPKRVSSLTRAATTPSMFNEDEIEAESHKAKDKFNQP